MADFFAFTDDYKEVVRSVLLELENIIDLQFQEILGEESNLAFFGAQAPGSGVQGWAEYPGEGKGGDIRIRNNYIDDRRDLETSRDLLLHEFGHALGLEHPSWTPAKTSS